MSFWYSGSGSPIPPDITIPQSTGGGSNLISNGTFTSGTTGWTLANCVRNASIGNKGPGCIEFTVGLDQDPVNYSKMDGAAFIAVTAETDYTFRGYIRSSTVDNSQAIVAQVSYYTAVPANTRTEGFIFTCAEKDTWEEFVMPVRALASASETQVILRFYHYREWSTSGTMYLDDLYLGTGLTTGVATGTPKGYEGTFTAIDSLGNVRHKGSGSWQNFIPIGISPDAARSDWTTYANAGFNLATKNNGHTISAMVTKAKGAGMMASIALSNHVNNGGSSYQDWEDLGNELAAITTADDWDAVLWYYLDDENNDDYLADTRRGVNLVKGQDSGSNPGRPDRPVYVLQKHWNYPRQYVNNRDYLVDVRGTYIYELTPATAVRSKGAWSVWAGINNGPSVPFCIAQINYDIGSLFNVRVMQAFARGAKGISVWRDDFAGSDITSQSWWSGAPTLFSNVQSMANIIRAPHWSDASASSDDSDIIAFPREANGNLYLIITNDAATQQTATITLSGHGFIAGDIDDFFTESNITTASSEAFSITVDAYDYQVVLVNES